MYVLVLAAEADETRQTIALLVACLVGIAVVLGILTVGFWLATSPKRRAVDGRADSAELEPTLIEVPPGADSGSIAPGPGGESSLTEPPGPEPSPEPADPEAEPVDPEAAAPTSTSLPAPGTAASTATWDFVAAARQAEDGSRISRPTGPPTPRIAVAKRTAVARDAADERDELARARKRRERRGEAGLSDEAWASVMRSAFEELDG